MRRSPAIASAMRTECRPPATPPAKPGFGTLGAMGCERQLNTHTFDYIKRIEPRRVEIADPETGLVFGLSQFRQPMDEKVVKIVGVPGVDHVDMNFKPSIFLPLTSSRFETARFTRSKPWASRCRTTRNWLGIGESNELKQFVCTRARVWSDHRSPAKTTPSAKRSARLFQKGQPPASQPLRETHPVDAKPARAVPTEQRTHKNKENKKNGGADQIPKDSRSRKIVRIPMRPSLVR